MIGLIGATWTERANCIGKSHLFYSEDDSRARTNYQEAKRVCAECPVTAECFRYAASFEMESNIHIHGFWAGMTENERAKLYQRMRRDGGRFR